MTSKKAPAYRDPCMPWLMKLSKAALADCVVDLLRLCGESCDEPVPESAAVERLQPVLTMRGDRCPPLYIERTWQEPADHPRGGCGTHGHYVAGCPNCATVQDS